MSTDDRIEDGGPAFPRQGGFGYGPAEGMSLRDYFAAKWLQGWLANPATVDLPADEAALCAYEMADAMLIARKGGES